MAKASVTESGARTYQETLSSQGAALSLLQASLEQGLGLATQAFRQTDDPLSADERAHAKYWARLALAMMSQPVARKIDDAVSARVAAVVTEAAETAKVLDEDADFRRWAFQAIDRMANRLLAEDLPLQIREAAYDAIGGQR